MSRPTAEIVRHATAYSLGSIVGGVTRAVLLPIIARELTKSEYGVLTLLLATANLLHLVLELGLVTALIRFHHQTDDAKERSELRAIVFFFVPLVDLILVALLALVRGAFSEVLFGTSEYANLVLLALAIAFFASLFQLFLGHLRAEDRSREFAGWMLLKGVASLGVTFWLVFRMDLGIVGFLIGNFVGPGLVVILTIPRLLARVGLPPRDLRPKLSELLGFGLPLVPSALGLWALTHSDTYLLRRFAGLESVGSYGFASELCLPIAVLMLAIQLAWPSFAYPRARREGGPEELVRVYRHVFVGLVGAALVVTLLRNELALIVGTETFASSARVLPLLTLATVLYAASQAFATGLQVAGDTRRLPVHVAIATVLNIGLNIGLIPSMREVGAAVATVATNVVLCALILRESNRLFPIPFELGKLGGVLVAAGLSTFVAEAAVAMVPSLAVMWRLLGIVSFPLSLLLVRAVSVSEIKALPAMLAELTERRA